MGHLIFGLANQRFGNLGSGILFLIIFFVAGLILLPFMNVRRAMEDVRQFDEAGA